MESILYLPPGTTSTYARDIPCTHQAAYQNIITLCSVAYIGNCCTPVDTDEVTLATKHQLLAEARCPVTGIIAVSLCHGGSYQDIVKPVCKLMEHGEGPAIVVQEL